MNFLQKIHRTIHLMSFSFFLSLIVYALVSNKWIHERGQEFRRPCALQETDWSKPSTIFLMHSSSFSEQTENTASSLLFMSTVSAAVYMWPVTFIFNRRVCVCVSQPLDYITSVSAFCHCTLKLQRKQLFLTTLHYNRPLAIELYNSIKSEHCSDSISPTLILSDSQIKVTNNRKCTECMFAAFIEWSGMV